MGSRNGTTPGISVVVPVYRSTTTLAELVERIDATLTDAAHEVVLVDDGSPGATWDAILQLTSRHPHVVGLRLGRNFGQHNALVAGIRAARFDTVVTIDDDLQNPPEEIPRLLGALDDGVDVVYGVPDRKHQSWWRDLGGSLSRRAIATALGADGAIDISSFRAFRTDLRDAFAGDVGPSVSLDALLAWGTSRFSSVQVAHHPREAGSSNYTARSLVRFAVDTATGYSAAPLQLATTVGFLTALFGLAVLVWVVGRRVVTGDSVPGFPFLASTIAIFAGVQLFCLGIMGEYLARMHFRLMRKPTYVVGERSGPPPGELGDPGEGEVRST